MIMPSDFVRPVEVSNRHGASHSPALSSIKSPTPSIRWPRVCRTVTSLDFGHIHSAPHAREDTHLKRQVVVVEAAAYRPSALDAFLSGSRRAINGMASSHQGCWSA